MMKPVPLTEAQEGLWYAQRFDPENPIFNTSQYVEIWGTLDVAAFEQAVNAAMQKARALSIRVEDLPDGPQLFFDPALTAQLRITDLRHANDPEHEAQSLMQRDAMTALDPTRDALAAQHLYQVGEEKFFWYQRVHHLVIDGYGTSLLTRRICDLYTSSVTGAVHQTSPFGSFDSVLQEDAEYRQSEKRQKDQEFWQKEFADKPEIPLLNKGLAYTSHTFIREERSFSREFGQRLQSLASEYFLTWPDILTALSAAYLKRHTGGTESILGIPTMNRFGSASAQVPSMIMNVLPVRFPVDESLSLQDFLISAAKKLKSARRHGRYRSEQLRRDLGLLGEHRRLHGPLINILPFEELPQLGNAETKMHIQGTGAVDDLTFNLRAGAQGDELYLSLDANPELFSVEDVKDHADRFVHFLEAAIQSASLKAVSTLTPEEHQHWVYEVNQTAHPVERTTLVELMLRQVRNSPDAEALRFNGKSLTYAQFEQESRKLAQKLKAYGVKKGDVVAIALPRSFELLISVFAIQRLGAAYLPLDPDHPADRISVIIDSAQPACILTFQSLKQSFPEDRSLIVLDHESFHSMEEVALTPSDEPGPDDAAYIIYTSGSTGVPKGVVIEHHSIVNRLEWMRTFYNFQPDDRILQKTPVTFDVSVWELFLPFLTGCSLVIAPPEAHKDPAWLARIIREEKVTTTHFVPSMLGIFLADPASQGLRMRRVFASGEELTATIRDRFHQVMKSELHNLYGPTEAAVDVTYWPASSIDESSPVPIGFPVWNTSMHILDEYLRPVPPSVNGDLYIGGVQLAREYLGRPDLTAERFIPNPFGAGRIYKTGDVAWYRRDGAIVYSGRSDFQIKIRGLRVELGEIEAAILSFGSFEGVAVIAREDRPGDQRIVAYLVPDQNAGPPDLVQLRSHVSTRVTDYMIPSAFIVMDEFPLNSSGKLDRKSLPKPELEAIQVGRPPETETEKKVAGLFAEALGLEKSFTISAEDDFFSLGGHSLLAARLMIRAREVFGHELGIGVLFTHPTVARFAAHLDQLSEQSDEFSHMDRQGLGVIIPLLLAESSSLPPVFMIHPAGGISWCYAGLARELSPRRSVYGVQARGLDLDQPLPETMDIMAADYVDQILKVQPEGPYHLMGWSVGGIIAQAMAVRLEQSGHSVQTLAMLDSYPCDYWRDEPDPDESTALKALLFIAGLDTENIPQPLTREIVVTELRKSSHPLANLSDDALSGVVRVVIQNNRLVRRHHHQRFSGRLIHFHAALDHQGTTLAPEMWLPYVGAVTIVEIPAVHAHMVSPQNTKLVARYLNHSLS